MSNIAVDYLDQVNRFYIGRNVKTGDHLLSIPVANNLTDYEEYYRLERKQYYEFLDDPSLALDFVVLCRQRKLDHLLILKPGANRGNPV
ncbi:hypothetical protein [Neisseria sp. Ec49-e6-T10]|uniref:hypothetical protein n=1 Tax=Neisseria sp. Ec49-e6-T10 TaxID=3140744 RepID=UPI003EC1263A